MACISTLAVTVLEILRTEIFDLEKLGQACGDQYSQCSLSIANIKKIIIDLFLLALTVFHILAF